MLTRLARSLVLALALAALAGAAHATTFPIEAESMTSFLNLGGSAITVVGCSAARGGLAVDGVDFAGDYLEWPLTLAQDFVFRDSLRTAGGIGVVRQFAVLSCRPAAARRRRPTP